MNDYIGDIDYVFKIFQKLFAPYKKNVCIAGGSVRDALMRNEPKDIDVFVLDTKYSELKKLTEDEKLLDTFKEVEIFEGHGSEPFLIKTFELYLRRDFLSKIGGKFPKKYIIQLMASPYKTVPDLVHSFDWNVSLFAYGNMLFPEDMTLVHFKLLPQVYCLFNPTKIKPGGYLELNKLTFPLSTLRRGYRFSERFGMKIRYDDLLKIAKEIIKNSEMNQHEIADIFKVDHGTISDIKKNKTWKKDEE